MTPTAPLFSIVIPTRNRANLLRQSLQTALDQKFDDFEVVVSDNGSNDRTLDVVKDFSSDRLRYATTGRDLPMPDSWDFALDHAVGKYVTFLCDDDASTDILLGRLATVLDAADDPEIIIWGTQALYTHPSWHEPESRNHLLLGPWTGELREMDILDTLNRLYRLEPAPSPRMLNSVASRAVFERIREKIGRVFLPNSPDYSFAAASLSVAKTCVYLDQPIGMNGRGSESIGASAASGHLGSVTAFIDEFKGADIFPDVPFSGPVVANAISQSLIAVARTGLLPEGVQPLDMTQYFLQIRRQLLQWKRNGNETGSLEESLVAAARSQPEPLRTAVFNAWRRDSNPRALRRVIRGFVESHEWLARTEERIRRAKPAMYVSAGIDGGESGFDDIRGAAEWLGRYHRKNVAWPPRP